MVRTFMRTLAQPGEDWRRTHNAIFTKTSLTFARVPAKVYMHQSSGEGAFCIWDGGLQNVPKGMDYTMRWLSQDG